MGVKNKRPPPVMQLGLVHSFVMWQAGKGRHWAFLLFIYCLFSAGSYGGRGQLLVGEIAGHLSKA